jgi:hypothetical protein
MEKNQLTPGDVLMLVKELRAMGATKGRVAYLEFEFEPRTPTFNEPGQTHMTLEEIEEKRKEIQRELDAEVYAAS